MTTYSTANQTQDPRAWELFREALYIRDRLRALINSPLTLENTPRVIFLWARQYTITHKNLMDLSGGRIEINW